MPRHPRDGRSRSAVRPWAGRTALIFVLLTLATLVVVPILVRERVQRLRAEIVASEPARTLVIGLQFNLVREMAAISELLLGGDEENAATYASAVETEQEIYGDLAPLAAQLGPDVLEQFVETRAMAARWHARTADADAIRNWAEGTTPVETPREQELFGDVVGSAVALDSTILEATARTRQRIAATERLGLQITLALGLLAVLAAIAAATLHRRVQRYSAEAEQRRKEAEKALSEVARANEARVRLLRGVTHDVKNPLGAAKGYAELLATGVKAPLQPEQAPLVEGVKRSVDSALAIIADLLDVARTDSGGLQVHRAPADLIAIARAAVDDHRPGFEAAGHTLEFHAPSDPVQVHTDPARVRQVLDNLLSNAHKYTPSPGRITVRADREEDPQGGEGHWATISVADSGPGVPADLTDRIFEEFTRGDQEASVKGHGLGLAIARRIARLLGGDLDLVDLDEPGATFALRLPLRADDAPDGPRFATAGAQ